MANLDSYSGMADYKLGTPDPLTLSGGSSLNFGTRRTYPHLVCNTAQYLLSYTDPNHVDPRRTIIVSLEELDDGTTGVKLVEKILPVQRKKPDSIVSWLIHKGKEFLMINYEALAAATPVERRCIAYVPSAQSMDEFVDVAVEAAELLMRQYSTVYYGDDISSDHSDPRTLEDMIITLLLKKHSYA